MEQEKKDFYEFNELQEQLDDINEDMELLKRCCKVKEKISVLKK